MPNYLTTVLALMIWVTNSYAAESNQSFGYFKGDVVAKWLGDGRNMKLEQPFGYVDQHNTEWSVPAGTSTDGASIPQIFWSLYSPFTGKYRSAAVVHDYYCQKKSRGWKATHMVFYNAMRAAKVDERTAKTLFAAVYYLGPRWGLGAGSRGPGADTFETPEDQGRVINALDDWIKQSNPSIETIANQLDKDPPPGL